MCIRTLLGWNLWRVLYMRPQINPFMKKKINVCNFIEKDISLVLQSSSYLAHTEWKQKHKFLQFSSVPVGAVLPGLWYVDAGRDHLAFLFQQRNRASVIFLRLQRPTRSLVLQHPWFLCALQAEAGCLSSLHAPVLALRGPVPLATITGALQRKAHLGFFSLNCVHSLSTWLPSMKPYLHLRGPLMA